MRTTSFLESRASFTSKSRETYLLFCGNFYSIRVYMNNALKNGDDDAARMPIRRHSHNVQSKGLCSADYFIMRCSTCQTNQFRCDDAVASLALCSLLAPNDPRASACSLSPFLPHPSLSLSPCFSPSYFIT